MRQRIEGETGSTPAPVAIPRIIAPIAAEQPVEIQRLGNKQGVVGLGWLGAEPRHDDLHAG